MDTSREPAFKLRGWSLCNIQQDIAFDEPYILRMLEIAASQGINYIELIGPYYNQPERCPVDSLVTYSKFPLLNNSRSLVRDLEQIRAENAKFNRICSLAKSLGMVISVWCHELWFPMDILDFYPKMGDDKGQVVYSSTTFQSFLQSKYEELFETIPDLGGIVLTTSESLALNIFSLPAAADRRLPKDEAYIHLLNTLAGVCKRYRRDLSVRMFGINSQERFESLLSSFRRVDPVVGIHQKTCDYGDWHNPFQKANPHLGAFVGRVQIAEEDLGQEYFGLGRFPVVFPEVLQQRAIFSQESGLDGMVARIDRASYGDPLVSFHNRVWEHEGQLNLIAFDALLNDPHMNLAQTVWPWAENFYGPTNPYALKALESGTWIFHDLLYIHPGEDASRHWRGAWLMPETFLDDQLGVFGALKEACGYRVQLELALSRCHRILGDLEYGEQVLPQCSAVQIQHYRALQAKFQQLLVFGDQRLAILDILAAFEALFFHSGGILKKKARFLETVDQFYARFGEYACDPFIDRNSPSPYSGLIQVLFDLLKATRKMDSETYGGYCGAGEV